ncbi:MAG: tRNA (adenosine(37)-N6)-threonylcarbamoyltransferase complex dimerization subunit type 1 TsaB [Candidatus Omnitrophica bacterium]|nr:tRNA (adenosine(37)-N6)-threonylcarbamoyltransferase complex dimerization subunit type 1 TsaB [Candidatus Omnitrophota bacterium]
MNLLAIDTSTENISLSIMWKGNIVFDFNRRIRFGASRLASYIDRYLKSLSLSLDKFDAFVIGAGPGSFTGLRISFSVIKAFSISLNKPIISIGSFISCAYPFIKSQENIAVISDARRQLIYGAAFKLKGGIPRQEEKEKLISPGEFMKEKSDYLFVTYDEHLRNQALGLHSKINFYPRNVYPKARYILLSAQRHYFERKFTPLEKLEPLYLHPKTCQVRNSL